MGRRGAKIFRPVVYCVYIEVPTVLSRYILILLYPYRGNPFCLSRALSIFTYKVSIIRAFVKQAGILGFQLIILSLGLLVVIEKGPRLTIERLRESTCRLRG